MGPLHAGWRPAARGPPRPLPREGVVRAGPGRPRLADSRRFNSERAPLNATDSFQTARQLLQDHRLDYDRACREFRWPVLDRFNWAVDWFDVYAEGNPRTALHLIEDDGREQRISYAELSLRSS